MMISTKERLKRGIRAVFPVFAALLLVFFLRGTVQAGGNSSDTLRIGLYWGDNALDSANLLNYKGSGYEFGYFDEERVFHALACTDETAITMLKDWSMYLYRGAYHTGYASGCDTVGCYHVRLTQTFASFEEAARTAAEYRDAFPAFHDGKWRVCVGSYTSLIEADTARANRGIDGEAETASKYCVTVVVTGSTRIIFQFDCGTERSLAVSPRGNGYEKAITWFKGQSYYGSFQYSRPSGNGLTVLNFVDTEDYVKGVIPYEMSSSWPLEALKAQAVAARTYGARQTEGGTHSRSGFDLCTTDCCQVYRGTAYANSLTDRAVEETSGVYMTYDGDYIEAFFHSSDGGATEDCENVFTEALPYIRGVIDPYEQCVKTGKDSWSYVYTAAEITDILNRKGYYCGNIVSVAPSYTRLGNIKSITFTDEYGKKITVSDAKAGSILYSSAYGKYTHSQRFTITDADGGGREAMSLSVSGEQLYVLGAEGRTKTYARTEQVSVLTASGKSSYSLNGAPVASTISAKRYLVQGSGWGHNLGMSQYGAKAMAELGMSYEDILSFYYYGVTIG